MPHFEPCDLEAGIALAGISAPSPRTMEAIRDAPERTAMDALQIKEGKILIGMNRLNIEVNERQARIASRRELPAGR